MAKRRAVVALGLLTLALAGCGDDSSSEEAKTTAPAAAATVDDAQVEQGIEEDFSAGSATVTTATCPGDVQAASGKTFTCDVTFSNGATGKVTATQVTPDRFAYELKPGSVQVTGAIADAALEEELAAQGVPNATVNCPSNIIVKTGTTVTCDVSGAQGAATSTVTFTFSTTEGTVDPDSVSTS